MIKIKLDGQKIWRSGNSYVVTLPDAKEMGIIEYMTVTGIVTIKNEGEKDGEQQTDRGADL
jgi:hypothetical protein